MNATKTQLAQIGDICRRRGIAIEVDPSSLTREDGDRLVRALLYIDGDQQLNPDLELVHQLEATRKEKPMEETRTDKTCSQCKLTKPADEFGLNRSTPDGLSYYCKACNRDRYRERKVKKRAKRSDKAEKPEASTPERPQVVLNGWRDTFTNPTLDQLEKLRDLVGVATLDEAAEISKVIARAE